MKPFYARCGVSPLTERVAKSRWKMLGHILRSDCNSPPQLALSFAVESMNSMKGRLGRHQINIFSIYVFLWRSHKKTSIDGLKWRDLVGGRWWLVNFKVSGVTKGFTCNTPQDSRHHVNVTRARGQPIPPQSYSISK